jgi:hypothetical protein
MKTVRRSAFNRWCVYGDYNLCAAQALEARFALTQRAGRTRISLDWRQRHQTPHGGEDRAIAMMRVRPPIRP